MEARGNSDATWMQLIIYTHRDAMNLSDLEIHTCICSQQEI